MNLLIYFYMKWLLIREVFHGLFFCDAPVSVRTSAATRHVPEI